MIIDELKTLFLAVEKLPLIVTVRIQIALLPTVVIAIYNWRGVMLVP